MVPLLLLSLLLGACSAAQPHRARQGSPYVEVIKDARSLDAATEAANRAREQAVNAAQP